MKGLAVFVPFEFASVNALAALRLGRYAAFAEFFGELTLDAPSPSATLIRYVHQDDDLPSAADLVVIEADGPVRVRDYVWLPSRRWRDSAGEVAAGLVELLAPELHALTALGSSRLADQVVLG